MFSKRKQQSFSPIKWTGNNQAMVCAICEPKPHGHQRGLLQSQYNHGGSSCIALITSVVKQGGGKWVTNAPYNTTQQLPFRSGYEKYNRSVFSGGFFILFSHIYIIKFCYLRRPFRSRVVRQTCLMAFFSPREASRSEQNGQWAVSKCGMM